MKHRLAVLAVLACLSSGSPLQAHFVWITLDSDSSQQPQVRVHFSEQAEPDSAALLDKVAAVKVWTGPSSVAAKPLTLTKQVTDEVGSWVAPAGADVRSASGSIKYGVLDRRGEVFLLWYHAKFLDAATDLRALGRDERLALDVVPHATDKGFDLEVLFQGQPATGSEVVVLDPEGNESTAKTDERGRISIAAGKPGLSSIRAKWTVKEAGKEGDQAYPQVTHYSTLALRTPAQPEGAAASAADLLRRARAARALWTDFPGFEADLALYAEGREQAGRIRIAPEGDVSLSGFELKDEKPILTVLRSLVGHRLANGESDDRVSLVDDRRDHPLGQLVKLDYDSAMASSYRIKDDVIREVNRQTEGGRFTISVFDVNRNPQGKYLPGYYTVNFWNQDGSLRSSTSVRETWIRVGDFDLPATHALVTAGKDQHNNVSLTFSNHKLLETPDR